MKLIYQFTLLIFIIIFNFSCKKSDDLPDANNAENNQPTYTQYGTPYSNIPGNEDIILYEINLRAFSPGGDLQGVIDRLDDLKELGANVIWLMPIHPIGEVNSVNSPYSVKDYKAVSKEYGSLEDLRTLTDEAHSRDIAVIIDWIANHTAWDNKWINNKDWYTQDASGNIIHPAGTNWQDVADLNFSNSDMRGTMIDAMKYWILEANIDGFRCDYADGVPVDFWEQAIDSLATIPNRDYVLLAEGSKAELFNAGFDLNYGWDFYSTIKNVFKGLSANSIFRTHNNEYNSIPAGKHKIRFTTNHDESAWDNTPMVLFNGKKGTIAASVVTIFMGGVPMIYTGQEVGRESPVPFFSNSPINWNDNPDMIQTFCSILNFYSRSDISKRGVNKTYPNNDVICLKKTLNNEEILILVNVRNSQVNFALPAGLQNTTWTDALTENEINLDTILQMESYQFIILK